jgi:hypothetical protein
VHQTIVNCGAIVNMSGAPDYWDTLQPLEAILFGDSDDEHEPASVAQPHDAFAMQTLPAHASQLPALDDVPNEAFAQTLVVSDDVEGNLQQTLVVSNSA